METRLRLARAAPIAALLIVLLAIFLRVETLGQRPLWYDETRTRDRVFEADSVHDIFKITAGDYNQHPPLYYLMLYLTVQLSSVTEDEALVILRAPSVVCAILTIGFIGLLARKLRSPPTALLAMLLCTLSIYHINYSLDAKAYSLVLLCLTLQLYCFYLLLERFQLGAFLGFVIGGAVAINAHRISLLTEVALGLGTTFWMIGVLFRKYPSAKARVPHLKRGSYILAGLLLVASSYLPQLNEFLGLLQQSNLLASKHTLDLTPEFVFQLLSRWSFGPDGSVYVVALLLLVGVAAALHRSSSALVLVLVMVLPLFTFALVPFSKFFDIRYMITALPVFFVFLAIGAEAACFLLYKTLERAPRATEWARPLTMIVASGLVLFVIVRGLTIYSTFRKTDYRCSQFFLQDTLLTKHNDFCLRHIVLNSLAKPYRHILEKEKPR